MKYIDHHAHMVSRTTDDYEAMAAAGQRPCCPSEEPARPAPAQPQAR